MLKGKKEETIALLNRLATFPIFRDSIFSAGLLKYKFYLDDVNEKLAEDFIHVYDDCAAGQRVRFEDQLVYDPGAAACQDGCVYMHPGGLSRPILRPFSRL